MSILPHVTTGAAFGSLTPDPLLASTLGFVSHFVIDFIPHWDPELSRSMPIWKKILYPILLLTDLSLGLLVLALLYNYPNMFWGGLVGSLLDFDNFFGILSKLGLPIHEGGSKWHKTTTFLKGVITQGLVTILGLIFIYSRFFS